MPHSPDHDVSPKLTRLFGGFHLGESLAPKHLQPFFRTHKENIRNKILDELSYKPNFKTLEIERLTGITPSDFRSRYMYCDRPVIFEGAAKNWESTKRWSLDFMRRNYGDIETLLVKIEGLALSDHKVNYQFSNLSDLVESIWRKEKKYLRVSPLVSDNPELKRQLDLNWLKSYSNPWSPLNGFQLFMGGEGGRTRLHCEIQANLYVMTHGEKRWRIYPNRYAAVFNPPANRRPYVYTEADIYEPDPVKYPQLEKADHYDFVLKQGDILYNPPFFWHDILNLSDSIGVGYRFGYLNGALRVSPAFSLLRMLATNPSPWKSLWYNMKDINLSVINDETDFHEVYEEFKKRGKLRKLGR